MKASLLAGSASEGEPPAGSTAVAITGIIDKLHPVSRPCVLASNGRSYGVPIFLRSHYSMSLRTNYVKFITHLDVDAVIPVMVAEGLLTRQEQAQLAEPGQTNRQRCEKILSYVPNKGRDFYYKFCCCIVWSGQTHLANLINFDMSTVPDPNKYLTAPGNIIILLLLHIYVTCIMHHFQ